MLALSKGKAVSLARRYWAFALPWMLVACLGPLREVARLHFLGSGLLPDVYGQFWSSPPRYGYNGDSDADDLPAGFDNDVRRFWVLENAPDGSHPSPAAAVDLLKHYPDVRWLPCVGAWAAMSGVGRGYTPRDFAAAQKMTRQAAALEPDNGFPAMCAALWEYKELAGTRHLRRLHHRSVSSGQEAAEDGRVLELWHVAAAKPRYDDHVLDVFRCIIASRESQRHLTVEEKFQCFWNFQGYDYSSLLELERWVMQRARVFRAARNSERTVGSVLDVAKLGSLMLHSKCADDTVRCGLLFLDDSTSLWTDGTLVAGSLTTSARYSRRTPRHRAVPGQNAAVYARQHGQLVAARTLQGLWSAAGALTKWRASVWRSQTQVHAFPTHDSNLFSMAAGRDCGMVLVCQGALVFPFWLVLATLFWRHLPAASSRRDRVRVALGCALLSAALGIIALLGFLTYGDLSIPPPPGALEAAGVATLLAFIGPVLFSWLACAGLTWRRQRALFELDARTQLEMVLAPRSAFLLSHFLAVGAWTSAGLLVVSTLAWLLFTVTGIASANIAAAWPHSLVYDCDITWEGISLTGIIYGLWIVAASLVLWILKWRYASGQATRPATFGALRWWKESLGAYLVLLSWLYLVLGLAYIPARLAAGRTFERLEHEGSLGVWRETAP